MRKIKLSIIIVNYRCRAYLDRCLASIFAKNDLGVAIEVIVVNNGVAVEMEGLATLYPEVRILQCVANKGFGSANNLGASVATGEILFFLNPDAEIISQGFSEIMQAFEKDPEIGILGSRLVLPDGNVQPWIAGIKISLWNILANNLNCVRDSYYWQSERPVEVFWVAGTALFIPKKLFLGLGGFDSNFFMYFEDVDLCCRMHFLDKKVVYFPGFSVLHHGGKSFLLKKNQKKNYYLSQDYYFRKHLGLFQTVLLKFLRLFSF